MDEAGGRIAYVECRTGASGNMILGAMIEAGVSVSTLKERLALLDLEGYSLEIRRVKRGPLVATHVDVCVDHAGHVPTTRLREITGLVEKSGLSEAEKGLAISVFRHLAEAEAEVHGIGPEDVHFHEVGAVDAIVDIVGAAVCLTELDIGAVWVSPMNLGGGWVDTSHGRLPVPAPATVRLVRGMEVYSDDVKGELLTPTGAAVLSTVARGSGPMPPMVVESCGYGAGTMELDVPNVLRVFVGRPGATGRRGPGPAPGVAELPDIAGRLGLDYDECTVIEASIDDMIPEFFDHVMERLFAAGALDVSVTPVQMKKNRPAWVLYALVPPEGGRLDKVVRCLFENTTTFGARTYTVARCKLARTNEKVETEFGPINVKIGLMGGRPVSVSPEYEDCVSAARNRGAPLKQVYDAARREANRRL